MAEIFLAKHILGNGSRSQIVAVKRILPHYASDAEFLEMFKHEAILSKSLHHINIAKVFDFCRVDGHFGIVMEFVPGTDLRSFLAQCEKEGVRLSVPMVVYIGICAAKGLHHAHSKIDVSTKKRLNIVHRDVSPQNIILGFNAEVKVIDFGIANFESKNNETKPGIVKGKYSYMSPEQVSAKKADARSDIFSLAIVLWEALAMKRLFAADTDVETIQNVLKATITRPLQSVNTQVDKDLEQILNKGLAREINDRYNSAEDFARDLSTYLSLKYASFEPKHLAIFASAILAERKISLEQDIAALEKVEIIQHTYAGTLTNLNGMDSQGNLVQQMAAGDAMGHILQAPSKRYAGNKASKKSQYQAEKAKHKNSSPQVKRPPQNADRKKAMQMPNRSKASAQGTLTLLMAATFTILVGLAASFYLKNQENLNDMEFFIKTQPRYVEIKLDGKYLYQGKTVKTPLRMSIPPGKHEIAIESSEHWPEFLKFEGRPNQKFRDENIILKAKPKLNEL